MTTFHGWAAPAARRPLAPFTWDPGELGALEVEIAVAHCGVCHSDLHLVDNDWRMSTFPFVPGHEIVGRVAAAGGGVAHLAVGQRVGVGWQRSACLACDLCLDRKDNLCAQQAATCVGHHGGFADRIRIDGRYAFALPDGLDGAAAAPLLCGGATVFAPLRRYGVGPSSSVGVIGIGGLGHLALRLLRALRLRDHGVLVLGAEARRGARHGRARLRPLDRAARAAPARRPLRPAPLHRRRAPRLDHLPADAAAQRHALPGRRAARASSRSPPARSSRARSPSRRARSPTAPPSPRCSASPRATAIAPTSSTRRSTT